MSTRQALCTGASVTTRSDGRLIATLHLHGELCVSTAPLLRAEIESLLDDGVTDLVLDLTNLRLCTSHGLDVWDDTHKHLAIRGGAVHLHNPRGAVKSVLDLVRDADPTFGPAEETASP